MLFGPSPRTMDCSAFCTLSYKQGGLPDPSDEGYKPIGWTGSMIAHCEKVSNPEPGDFVFYGPSEAKTLHVTLYVGNGNVISMGGPADPSEGPAAAMGPCPPLGYYRPN